MPEQERKTADTEPDLEQVIRSRQAVFKNPPPISIAIEIDPSDVTDLIALGWLKEPQSHDISAVTRALCAMLTAAFEARLSPKVAA